MVDATQFMQFVANGVSYGAILALAAIGLSLVYGILNLSNFAHGDFLTLGAFAGLAFATLPFLGADGAPLLPIHPGVALVAAGWGVIVLGAIVVDGTTVRRLSWGERSVLGGYALATIALAGLLLVVGGPGNETTDLVLLVATVTAVGVVSLLLVGLEFLIWRPLRRRRATSLTLIIVSIGLALVVRNVLQLKFGGENHQFLRPGVPADRFFGVLVSDAQQFTLLAALVIIGVVHLFLNRTRAGKAMRALADNPDLARVTGIDVDRMVVYVWVIAGSLLTVAGVLLSLVQNNLMNVNMGFNLLIALFAAVIVGGIGSAYGAMIGGFIVGIAMKTSALWLGTKYELAAAFILLIVVLVLRPQGILGGKV